MNRFRTKLLVALISLILLVLLALGLLLGQLFKSYYLNIFNERLEKETTYLAERIEENGGLSELNRTHLKSSVNLLDLHLTVLNSNGDVLFDNGSPLSINDKANEDIVRSIFKEMKKKNSTSGNVKRAANDLQFYWKPIISQKDKKAVEGLLVVSAKVDELKRIYQQIWLILSISLGLALVVIILLGTRIMTSYTKPIESATKVAIELAKGNYRARTYEEQVNEAGMLSSSINILARNLQEMVVSQEMQQDRLSTLIENMGSGLVLIDSRGYVTLINRSYKENFNIEPTEFLQKRYHEVIKHKEVVKLVEEIFMTEKNVRRQLLLSLDIERRHFEVYGAPIIGTNDEWNGILLVFHDITDLKMLEQMRKDFVANVSHELKTPITSIKGFSETLLDGAMHDEEALKSFLNIILNESDRLQSLIQDLLDLSKIEQQGFKLNVQPLDLSHMLEEVMKMLENKADSKNIELQYNTEDLLEIEGDVYRLKQVFINLINNAIAYTPSGGSIKVHASSVGSRVKVEVSDTGIGIAQEEIPRIFERFYRVDKARSRNSGGTGLGLAIVKHLVEAHRGYISVKSKVGEGTVFTVYLTKSFPAK
ncbi:two-component system histidine kinase PnpS [Falsibacillus albus]|uniref:Phosphate regulon sensor protein PhoR n=1 Tax=Falsibacillus albus TaxID=2478915 RepID=A0A3L7K6P0_9BACI|nr:ATP-binding protein [Falsibacillus albus]RLQ97969.1 HAMP domain-containing histidine kinase [Falsibacillus albus]